MTNIIANCDFKSQLFLPDKNINIENLQITTEGLYSITPFFLV